MRRCRYPLLFVAFLAGGLLVACGDDLAEQARKEAEETRAIMAEIYSGLKVALPAINDFRGACGRVSFDQNGGVVQFPQLFIIRDGRASAYERFTAEGGVLEIPGRE